MKLIIHQEHFGVESLKKPASQALILPLINSKIKDMIKNCPTCLAFHDQQPSKPAIKHPVLHEPQNKLDCKTSYSLPNISQENNIEIRAVKQNLWDKKGLVIKQNQRNNKRFINRVCLLLFLMGIFLKHLRLVSIILK